MLFCDTLKKVYSRNVVPLVRSLHAFYDCELTRRPLRLLGRREQLGVVS